ncbi:MAG: anhydro-N-acetylmuramic acid kinase [Cytophagaceae bacterium]|nr:anhydro-N-acetylmuramic acid kinase [Cytophagaceae bacterium]|tara:strand:+ start:13781 stop:14854 length:1074 start_codon:yes stop_codon:yes gene_type:complete
MNQTTYKVLGVMSGTSVDGIDFAYAEFTKTQSWNYKILKAETVAYPREWQKSLRDAIGLRPDEIKHLNKRYTHFLGKAIKHFIDENAIKDLDAVCSHGHTILHEPAKGFTLQIGNLEEIAAYCGQRVICDFRVQDVHLGGEGAPLVPIGDKLLFDTYDFCLNLGGFANVSYDVDGQRIAYDICPVNIVLNRYAEKLGLEYDESGKIAANHAIDQKLLATLNALDFYEKDVPKSLGLEWVLAHVLPIIDKYDLKPEEVIATFTEHAAFQIANAFAKAKHTPSPVVLATGGGAYNTHLIKRVGELSGIQVFVPCAELVEFKEALVFGFMGVLRMRNASNVLRSVTGASHDHCTGKIFIP